MESKGLPVHEEEFGSSHSQLLGWVIDGLRGCVEPTPKRFWRVRNALTEVLEAGRCSTRQMQKLVGHCTFMGLIRRESLSCFNEVYKWMHSRGGGSAHILGEAVERELFIFRSIMPFLKCDMRAEFSPEVYMVDASTWGQGVVCARVSTTAVRREFRYNDRWRWRKDAEPGGARRQWELYTLGEAKSDDRCHGEGVNRCAWGGGKGVDWGPKSDHAGRA